MNNIKPVKYLAASAPLELAAYLEKNGFAVRRVAPLSHLVGGICDHPDLRYCRMGLALDAPVIEAPEVKAGYPEEVAFNAACTGRYLICNPRYTAPEILDFDMELVDVAQGYAKCSVVIVDENSIITYDEGISRRAKEHGLDVLTVSPGHVHLDGYKTGFIGGASGRVNDQIVFNGDLTAHPDFAKIKDFIESRGLRCIWFEGWPLTDIGSIV